MLDVALTQQIVPQHRAKRRRERHGELERHAVVYQSLHHPQQRNVGFGDRFEKPIFLQKPFVLGMPNERQMRVENYREVTSQIRNQSVRQKSWKRSRPFLITSMLVA